MVDRREKRDTLWSLEEDTMATKKAKGAKSKPKAKAKKTSKKK